ncbi:MAG: LapA family protein [Proteobacteria bacterium]|nr:LapA family protein [Pseudomonadota bacterium]
MKTIKQVLVLTISIALVLVAVQNTAPIQARFLWFTTEMPVILLLFLTAAGGFILGLIVSLLAKSGTKLKS